MITISYAVISPMDDDKMYEVPYGNPVGAKAAERWLLNPPLGIRKNLKPGMFLLARDAPYSVLGFSAVQEDGGLITRYGNKWHVNGKDVIGINHFEVALYDELVGIHRKLAWSANGMNGWSEVWSRLDTFGTHGGADVTELAVLIDRATQNPKLTARVAAGVLKKVINHTPARIAKEFDSEEHIRFAESVLAAIALYIDTDMTSEEFAQMADEGIRHARMLGHGSLLSVAYGAIEAANGRSPISDFMGNAVSCFHGLTTYEGGKIVMASAKKSFGFNNLLFEELFTIMLAAYNRANK